MKPGVHVNIAKLKLAKNLVAPDFISVTQGCHNPKYSARRQPGGEGGGRKRRWGWMGRGQEGGTRVTFLRPLAPIHALVYHTPPRFPLYNSPPFQCRGEGESWEWIICQKMLYPD